MLPHLAGVVDEISIIRSVHTDQFNHAPAQIFLNTGFSQPGRPSLGSWVIYGLGSEAQDLPAFVVMSTGSGISGGSANWSSGFLPTIYTGVRLRNQGDPILNVSSPPGVDARLQRDSLDLLGALNGRRLEAVGDPEIATRIASYEMAFRLNLGARAMDLKREATRLLSVWCRPRQTVFRPGLSPGAAYDRARRAVRQHLPRGLGCSLRRRGKLETKGPPIRPPPRLSWT